MRRPPADAYTEVSLVGLSGGPYLTGEHVSTKIMGKRRVTRGDDGFMLRSHQHGFEEVMVYFHIDSALRYLKALGYRGANRIFKKVILADATGTREDNSWYSPTDKTLTFGTGAIDDAEDGETIVHELGHAIQDAICPISASRLRRLRWARGLATTGQPASLNRRSPSAIGRRS